MRKSRFHILAAAVLFILSGISLSFAQQASLPAQQISPAPKVEWLWGEVVLVDASSNSVNVRYVDPETDNQKDITIIINENTKFENVKSIADIAAKDSISFEYIVDAEGNNLATSISVEKIEAIAVAAENVTESSATAEKQPAVNPLPQQSVQAVGQSANEAIIQKPVVENEPQVPEKPSVEAVTSNSVSVGN